MKNTNDSTVELHEASLKVLEGDLARCLDSERSADLEAQIRSVKATIQEELDLQEEMEDRAERVSREEEMLECADFIPERGLRDYDEACGAVVSRELAFNQVKGHCCDWPEFLADCGDQANYRGQVLLDWLGY